MPAHLTLGSASGPGEQKPVVHDNICGPQVATNRCYQDQASQPHATRSSQDARTSILDILDS